MRKIYEAAVLFLGTLGWWGFVYPELCLDGEVYEETVREQDPSEEPSGETGAPRAEEGRAGAAAFKETADSRETGWQLGEIRIKSRLVEYVCQIKENAIKEKRLNDEGQDCAGGSF